MKEPKRPNKPTPPSLTMPGGYDSEEIYYGSCGFSFGDLRDKVSRFAERNGVEVDDVSFELNGGGGDYGDDPYEPSIRVSCQRPPMPDPSYETRKAAYDVRLRLYEEKLKEYGKQMKDYKAWRVQEDIRELEQLKERTEAKLAKLKSV